jgi:hypothetical protein
MSETENVRDLSGGFQSAFCQFQIHNSKSLHLLTLKFLLMFYYDISLNLHNIVKITQRVLIYHLVKFMNSSNFFPFTFLFIYLPTYLPVYPSIYLSIYTSIYKRTNKCTMHVHAHIFFHSHWLQVILSTSSHKSFNAFHRNKAFSYLFKVRWWDDDFCSTGDTC